MLSVIVVLQGLGIHFPQREQDPHAVERRSSLHACGSHRSDLAPSLPTTGRSDRERSSKEKLDGELRALSGR